MIEVEKKCLATSEFLDFLKNNSEKLGERVFEDVYLDFEDLRLIKNDIWLRKRNGKYELKVPMSDNRKSDVYEEIENEAQILEKLDLKNFDDLTPLSILITHRQKFQIDDFHIDLDEITSPKTDFRYNMMEIELMVESFEDYEDAQKRILEFMQKHSLKAEIVNGKVIEYFRRYRRDIFELFKANPHHSHRIVDSMMKEVTIRTNNSVEGIKKIEKLWQNVINGNIPLVLTENTVLISKYSNYASNENGDYDLSILAVDCDFMRQLEKECANGKYKKYDFCSENADIAENTKAAWQQVWTDTQEGKIKRSYTEDYECTIPANYSQDHKLHCLLYISIEKNN